MPLASRALVAACLLLASPATAAITDPQMSCADYLKTRPGSSHTHKAAASDRTAAAIEARIRSFCAANPKMKAMDAEMTVTGD